MVIEVTYNVTDVYMSTTVSPIYITVDYSGSGGSGASAWGSITGTLSNQTDLQTALDAKFDDPTGTTSQYLRGDGSLATFPAIPSGTVTSVGLSMPSAFSVANSPVTSSGTLTVTGAGDTTQYIAGDGSLVAFPITGQAGTLIREVRNNTGATLTKGTVCYINGASGNKPTVAKAIATTDATSAQTFGLIQADIPNNTNGYLIAFGDLDGLNTSAFAEGVQLYLSATTAGGYTSTKQYAPNHLVYIGVVTRQHVNQGRIEVRIQNGYEMDELHNVDAQTPSNNDGLFYETLTSLWKNKSISTVLGYTPEQPITFSSPLSRSTNTVSIPAATSSVNGYLSSTDWSTFNGKQGALTLTTTGTSGAATLVGSTLNIPQYSGGGGMAIGGSITSATAGSVLFAGTSGVLAQDNSNLFWDNTNKRLGIGKNNPAWDLEIGSNSNAIISANTASTANNYSTFLLQKSRGTITSPTIILNGDVIGSFQANPYNGSSYSAGATINFIVDGTFTAGQRPPTAIVFSTATAGGSVTDRMRLFATGNIVLQNGGTFTDAGYRLDVSGTSRHNGQTTLTGSVTASSALAQGVITTPTLLAAANNDVLVGLDVNPTFTNGAFTGVSNYGLRVATNILVNGSSGSADPLIRLNAASTSTLKSSALLFNVNNVNKFVFGYTESSSTPRFFIYNSTTDKDSIKIYDATSNIAIGNAPNANTDAGFRLDVNGTMRVQSKMSLSAGTTSNAQINLASSTAPTSPNNGDIWFDGTDIKMRIGGVTKTFTLI